MATYFFSTSTGDDSRSSTQAQSQSTPWKTISKFNSFFSSLAVGDTVQFKAGETFTGNMVISRSGSSGNPITIGAYGTGAKPIISGFYTVPSWTSIGGNLYTATIPAGLSTCGIVTLDGAFVAMGKNPKTNTGYYTLSSMSGSSSVVINSSGISGVPSMVGGEVCWRARHWVLWRGTITAQTSNSVTATALLANSGGPTELASSGYGFFFQNHPNACTNVGEWAYNPSSHVLTMNFGAAGPSGHTVSVSSVQDIVTTANRSFITFNGLNLQGGNQYIFNCTGTYSNFIVTNCTMFGAGIHGFRGDGTSSAITLSNNNLSYCNSNGFNSDASGNGSSWTITGNTVDHIGAVAGMGGTGEGQYFATRDIGNNSIIRDNSFTNCGYVVINFKGTNVLVKNNFIDTFCFVKDDGGGIYFGGFNFASSIIDGNIILNGVGVTAGTPDSGDPRSFAIYADDGTSNVEIKNNTGANCGGAGFYNHVSHNINVHDNTWYNSSTTQVKYYNSGDSSISAVIYTANIAFSRTVSQLVVACSGGATHPNTWFTTLDNNYYCRPLNESNDFQTLVPSVQNFNLTTWKSFIGKDANSHITPITLTDVNKIRFDYNNTLSNKVVALPGTYMDVRGVSYVGSITLLPFTSAVLLQTSATTSTTSSTTAAPTTTSTTTTTTAGSTTTTTSHSTTTTTTIAPTTTTTTTSSTTTTTTVALTDLPFISVSGVFVESPTHTWGSGYGYGLTGKYLAAAGWIQADFAASNDTTAILGLDLSNTLDDYALFDYAIYVASGSLIYTTIANNVFTNSGVAALVGDKYRLNRTGSTITASYSRDNGQTWVLLRTFAVTSSANLYAKASIPTTNQFLVNPKGRSVSTAPTTTTTTTSTSTTTTTTAAPTTTTTTTTHTTTTTSTTTTTTAAPTTTTTTTAAPTTTTTTTTAAPTTTTTTTSTSTTSTSSTTTTTTLHLTALTYTTISGSFTQSPSGTWGSGYGYALGGQYLAASGFIQATFNGTSTNTTAILGLDPLNVIQDFPVLDYALYIADGSNVYTTIENNTFGNTGVTAQVGDFYRLNRTGNTITAGYSRDNGQHWTILRTFPVTSSAILYSKASIPMVSRFLLNPKGYQVTNSPGVTTTTTTTAGPGTTTTTSSTTNTSSIAPLVIKLVKKTNVSCRGGSNGLIQLSATGGSGGYLFRLNTNSFQSSGTFTGLISGRYTATVMDSGGRLATLTVTVYNGFFSC